MKKKGDIVIYQGENNGVSLNVRLEDENVWLTQANLVELYQTSKSNVSEHIKHIFEEGELEESSVVRKFRTTAADGKNYETTFYNLDLIISLGYRIKSRIATQFRIWATQAQIAELFGIERSVATKHLRNIIKDGELQEESICAIFAHMGNDGKQKYETKYYNLDAILSVGYRANSGKAIIFRKWANKILKDYLLKGVAINQKRLEQLNKTLEIISRSDIPEISGIANVLQDFADGLDLLDRYDHQNLLKPKEKNSGNWQLTYEEAIKFVNSMKFGKESSLFGHEKDQSF